MWFRVFMVALSLSLWGITLWLATHQNNDAAILGRYSPSYFLLIVTMLGLSGSATFLSFSKGFRLIYPYRQGATLLVTSAAVSLCLAEVVIRLLDPIGISYYQESKRYHLDKIADPYLYYRHQSNLIEEYQGVSVHTNSLGLRDDEVPAQKSGELRVLFLGDSVTFGWGVEASDSFVKQVGDLLEKRLQVPIRAINSGVGSYNTTTENAFLQRHGEALQPDAVVLVYVSNDVEAFPGTPFDPWTRQALKGKNPPQVLSILVGKSWVYRLISHIGRHWGGGGQQSFDLESAGWQESLTALAAAHRYCADRGIPFGLFMYRMVPGGPENEMARHLRDVADREGFYYHDLLAAFDGQDVRLLVNSVVDSHPNRRGHELLALEFEGFLENVLAPAARGLSEAR
ncbi:MAG: SGNH/GDSL hydrolase family protein [Xanthomonadales bacterium]|nr:SGNH/GDSL hydrolase family protein [Xanthomonadales bacterium]